MGKTGLFWLYVAGIALSIGLLARAAHWI